MTSGAVGATSARDVALLAFPVLVLAFTRRLYCFRGVTYRSDVLPLWKERVIKLVLYLGSFSAIDVVLRRATALLGYNAASRSGLAMRLAGLWAPALMWLVSGPLTQTSRDDSGYDFRAQRWGIWRFLSARVFKHTKVVLSEEWRNLSKDEVRRWQNTASLLIGLHPHGLLPMGGIINGLTVFGGYGSDSDKAGMECVTTSGARDVPKPVSPGPGLHQRCFPLMELRCAVASGVFLPPGFFEMYRKLGGIECTKPHMRAALRANKYLAVYPGGATESRFATPGRYACYVLNRKGFLRLALEERRHLGTIWTFGDEGIVPQPWNLPKFVIRLQDWLKEATGLLIPPIPIGLPRFPPLTSVVGVPIDLSDLWAATEGGEVSDEAVETAQKRYLENLRMLFETNKKLVPGDHGDATLEFL
eukprot:TRINITY_DN7235_c0_g1_i1.p1 TRINITY_DN7235_c0_g1~~TRINITY_DN7235_c0_g1_i1.p1  ORF type:complete len:417 (-),score=56.05 TRINITY_DN7235_c0_g1_i1:57-1307(-)